MSRVSDDRHTGRYKILHVTGPNEAIVDLSNDSYTNAIAPRTLAIATEAARLLGKTPNPAWARIGPKILSPFNATGRVHLEHSGDLHERYVQGLILMSYLLNIDFSDTVKRNDLDACLKTFGKPGYSVGMMGNFYSIVASELDERCS